METFYQCDWRSYCNDAAKLLREWECADAMTREELMAATRAFIAKHDELTEMHDNALPPAHYPTRTAE